MFSKEIVFNVGGEHLIVRPVVNNVAPLSNNSVIFLEGGDKFQGIKYSKEYEMLGQEKSKAFTDPLYDTNAGLIIVAPFLEVLFDKCGLLIDNEFKNKEAQFKSTQLLHYLATGREFSEEHKLIIHKILCGLQLTEAVQNFSTITDDEKNICDSLLKAITVQWTPLNNTTIDALRTSFLQRDGRIEEDEEGHFLQVEQKSYDMLLDQIPWSITKIKLNWMSKTLNVQWR